MTLSPKESAVFSRLSFSQKDELRQLPEMNQVRLLRKLSQVSQREWNLELAKERITACFDSIVSEGKPPDWHTGYLERSRRRELALEASFMPPMPEWMRIQRRDVSDEITKEIWLNFWKEGFSRPTSNLNGRGGFGD